MESADIKGNGWGWPSRLRRDHFFVNGRSLCKRHVFYGTCRVDLMSDPKRCVVCQRRRERQIGKKLD
jgi:hypothetical protein